MKVFILTGTIGNEKLLDCIISVQTQKYEEVEHVIVVDGKEHEEKVDNILNKISTMRVPITKLVLPWNTGRNKFNGHKIYAGVSQFIHSPALITFLDEDNFVTSDHISSMVSTIKEKDLDWCYCLRNVVEPSGKFICRDMCESLGNLSHTWISKNDHLIDMSCYLMKAELIQALANCLQRPARANPEPDRLLHHQLNKNFPKSGCSMKYTLNYRVDSRGDSVKGEFFVKGNQVMNQLYNNKIPWDTVS